MKRSLVWWLVSGVAVVTCASVYYFGFVRHGKGATSPSAQAALARKTVSEGPVEVRRQAAWTLALTPNASNREALEKALTDQDVEVRRTAIAGLGWLKAPASLTALARAAKDPDTSARHDAAWALGQLPEHRGYEALVGLMKDKEFDVVRAAVAAIGGLNFPDAEAALNAGNFSDFQSKQALEALLRFKAKSALEATQAMAERDLDSAFEFAARIDDCRGIPFLVSTATTRGDSRIDETAARYLAQSTQPCVLDALVGLTNGNAPTRRKVAELLSSLGGPRAVEVLTRLQQDSDPRVAKAATEALQSAFAERKLKVPDLTTLAKSSNAKDLGELQVHLSRARILRTLVSAGLSSPSGRLGWLEQARADVIVPVLLGGMSPKNPNNWLYRVAISASVDENAVPALADAAKSADPEVRQFVADALLGLTSADARTLISMLTNDPLPRVRTAAILAYGYLPNQEASSRVEAQLASDQPRDWELAYSVLRHNGGSEAIARALKDLESGDATRQGLAKGLLASVSRKRAAELLQQLAASPALRGPILELLQGSKLVDAFTLSRPEIIAVVVSLLGDPNTTIASAMACLLSQVSGSLSTKVESEYRQKGASASLGQLLARGTEAERTCAKNALAAIGDERGLSTLLDGLDAPIDWSDVTARLKGRVTPLLAKKLIQRLSRDENTDDSSVMGILSTASLKALVQTYVPLLCNRSAPLHERVVAASYNWGVARSLGELQPGRERDCLREFVRSALVGGNEQGQRVSISLIELFRDKDLVDALYAFAQKLQPGYVGEVALRTLAEMGDARALPLILKAASLPEPARGLASMLASYDDPRASVGLLSVFTNEKLRELATDSLVGRLPNEQWALLADLTVSDCADSSCGSSIWHYRSQLRLPVPESALALRLRDPASIAENINLLGKTISNEAFLTLLAALEPAREVPSEMRRWNSPATLEWLSAALAHTNPKVRVNAIRIIADFQRVSTGPRTSLPPNILDGVAAALDDSILAVRVAAAEALGKLEDPSALPYLGDFIATWPPRSPEFGAGLCAWASLGKDAAAKALAMYDSPSYLAHNIDDAIPPIIRALGCSHSEAAVAPLVSHLERFATNDWLVIEALGNTRQPTAAKVLVNLMSSGQCSVTVLRALGKLQIPEALSALLAELEHLTCEDDTYRRELLRMIATYKDDRALNALLQALASAKCADTDLYESTLVTMHDKRAIASIEQAAARCHQNVRRQILALRFN